MTTIQTIHGQCVVRPMRTTFATACGSKTSATSIIVKVTCSDGTTGVGEVPTSFVVPDETPDTIKHTIHQAKKLLYGCPVEQWSVLAANLQTRFPDFHMTCSGLEVAIFRAWLTGERKTEHEFWGSKLNCLTTDITIPFIPDMDTLKPWLKRSVRNGFQTYKIKVCGNVEEDIKFIRSITNILSTTGTPCTIRLDGNQGFTCDTALYLLDKLDESVELFEQPLKHDDYDGMKQLCRKSSVPVIADETVFSVDDAQRVIEQQLAHGINIKIAKSGVTQSRQIIKLAKKAKLKLMIGCMTETMTGLSAAIYCAAGTGQFDYIDLDSIHFLNHRRTYSDINIDGSAYRLGEQL